jgi:predicted ferric reductase
MKPARLYLSLASLLLLTLGFWFQNQTRQPLGNALTGDLAGRLLAYGRLAGLLAAFGLLLQLVLVGRITWVERVFGLDRLTRLHHIVGFSLALFLLSHPVLVTAGHALQGGVSWSEQLLDFFRNWEDVLAAAIGLALLLAAVGFSIAIIRSRLPYEAWYATHLTIYIALALAFGHQLAVGYDFLANRAFAFYWYALYAFVFGNLLYYRVLRPLLMYRRHRFFVEELRAEVLPGDVVGIPWGLTLEDFGPHVGEVCFVLMVVQFVHEGQAD